MNFIKRHPLFSLIMAVFAVVIVLEVWYSFVLKGRVAAAREQVELRVNEIERLQRAKPAPTQDNENAVREDFALNAEVLSTMLRVLNVVGADELPFFSGEPTDKTNAYFEISNFVERMEIEAKKSGVTLRPDEKFGFATYAFTGPEAPFKRSVYRQHKIVEYLLQRLFAARPRNLIAVQREEPAVTLPTEAAGPKPAPGAGPANATAGAGSNTGEIFVIDPQVSARTPGYVDTMAFRIVFSGQTSALRGFMNALAAPDIPLVVRSVEVASGSSEPQGRGGVVTPAPRSTGLFGAGNPPGATNTATVVDPVTVPIVAENHSVFTVTIELFEVKIRAPDVAALPLSPR